MANVHMQQQPKTKMIKLTNDFHNTEVFLRCKPTYYAGEVIIYPSVEQIKRAKRVLCGIEGCTCSGDAGTRGHQRYDGWPLVVNLLHLLH